MMISNMVTRVLRIKVKDELGTAFSLDYNDKQYIITAKHLFKKVAYPYKYQVEFMENNAWLQADAKIFYHGSDVDIAVLYLHNNEINTEKYEINFSDEMFFGMDLFFLGFPFGYAMEFPNSISKRPIPLIKKGLYSRNIIENGVQVFLLDGHNNFGFSGGPVYYVNMKSSSHTTYIAGVVSGYRYTLSELFDFNGNELPYFIKENSGIIRFYPIKYVREIIESL